MNDAVGKKPFIINTMSESTYLEREQTGQILSTELNIVDDETLGGRAVVPSYDLLAEKTRVDCELLSSSERAVANMAVVSGFTAVKNSIDEVSGQLMKDRLANLSAYLVENSKKLIFGNRADCAVICSVDTSDFLKDGVLNRITYGQGIGDLSDTYGLTFTWQQNPEGTETSAYVKLADTKIDGVEPSCLVTNGGIRTALSSKADITQLEERALSADVTTIRTELETKIGERVLSSDYNEKINRLETAIGEKASTADLENLSATVKAISNDYLTSSDKNELVGAIAKKVESRLQSESGAAEIFNEIDGGGAKFTADSGITSYVGVNDPTAAPGGLAGQLYVISADGGTKLNMYKDGFCYVNDGTATGAFSDAEMREKYELQNRKDVKRLISDTVRPYVSSYSSIDSIPLENLANAISALAALA